MYVLTVVDEIVNKYHGIKSHIKQKNNLQININQYQ